MENKDDSSSDETDPEFQHIDLHYAHEKCRIRIVFVMAPYGAGFVIYLRMVTDLHEVGKEGEGEEEDGVGEE